MVMTKFRVSLRSIARMLLGVKNFVLFSKLLIWSLFGLSFWAKNWGTGKDAFSRRSLFRPLSGAHVVTCRVVESYLCGGNPSFRISIVFELLKELCFNDVGSRSKRACQVCELFRGCCVRF